MAKRDLRDLGFAFTWCNNKDGEHLICERLDLSVASSRWCELFPNGHVTLGHIDTSYHYLKWLDIDGKNLQLKG